VVGEEWGPKFPTGVFPALSKKKKISQKLGRYQLFLPPQRKDAKLKVGQRRSPILLEA